MTRSTTDIERSIIYFEYQYGNFSENLINPDVFSRLESLDNHHTSGIIALKLVSCLSSFII